MQFKLDISIIILKLIFRRAQKYSMTSKKKPKEIKNLLKGELADRLIQELGGVTKVANICKIATSSVCSWREQGCPRARLMYLKLAYPELKVWKELNRETN